MNRILFNGTCTAVITPFTKDGIDYDALERLLNFQIQNGVDAVCLLGTTGEGSTVTKDEYEYIAKFAFDVIQKRVTFVLGSGCNSTKSAIEKSQLAEKCGADGLLVVTPYYNKCTQNGLINYYNDICNNVDIPVLCYNVPGRTSVNVLPETFAEIAQNNKICGIKEASGNLEQIAKTARLIRGKTALYSGDDNLNLASLTLGSKGVVSVASNIIPKKICDIYSLYQNNETEKAIELQEKYLPLITSLFSETNPIPIKKAMSLAFGFSDYLRPPLTVLEEAHTKKLVKTLKTYNLI